ncbi:MAG: translocation/assembly module TamB domain-containing protein, partial [Vulcanococcus sp.]
MWWALDRAGSAAYQRLRPWLEWQMGRVMGHPLELGPYRGLRPWGLSAGASRFRPGPDNPSSINAAAVAVSFDPLRSLMERAWVLQIQVRDARVDLRRNSRGAYWELGRLPPGREPPRLGLRIRLDRPAAVRLHPAVGAPIALQVEGESSLQLRRRDLSLAGLALPAAGGSLRFGLQANWRRREWGLQLLPSRLPAAPLLPLLPSGAQQQLIGRLQGRIDGQLRLRHGDGCQGELQLSDASWRAAVLPAPLRSASLPLRCRQDRLQLDPAAVAMGDWRGRLAGSFALDGPRPGDLELQLQARDGRRGHRLTARLHGPWRRPLVDLQGSLQGLRIPNQPPLPLLLDGRLALRFQPRPQVQLSRLLLRRGDASLVAAGSLWPELKVRTSRITPGPQLLRPLLPLLGADPRLQASALLQGRWGRPQLALDLRQPSHPLLGSLTARLRWLPGLLTLESLRAPELVASGQLPLPPAPGGGVRPGPLTLRLDLRGYRLERLSGLIGSRLRGQLEAWGEIHGPLQALRPNLRLIVRRPGVGPLQLEETWQGRLLGREAGGADLALQPQAPAPLGDLQARLDRRWLPQVARLQRADGQLSFSGSPRRYLWQARRFPLEGLRFALGPRGVLQPLAGLLSGRGSLDLQPLWIQGSVAVQQPQLLGLPGRSLEARGWYRQRRYGAEGTWLADRGGQVAIRLRGQQGGDLWSRFEGRELTPALIDQLQLAWLRWRGEPLPPAGRASDLGVLAIVTLGRTVNEQLASLLEAQRQLRERHHAEQGERRELNGDLDGRFDADLTLAGPRVDRLSLDLNARGHVWWQEQGRDRPLTRNAPFTARLQGPLWLGRGSFSLQNLPLALLALLTPVPEGLRGTLSGEGRYSLGDRRRKPQLSASLALQDASLEGQALALEKGELSLVEGALELDLALRGGSAANSVDLRGRIPLVPQEEGLELRLASRGDGLRFLSALSGPGLQWQSGSADLQLLVRGSLAEPVANGFLRFREGVLQLAGQTMRDLEATVLFDFRELELQQLTARLGPRGQLSGSGQLALLSPADDAPRLLRLNLSQVPFRLPRMAAQVDGDLLVSGALRRPVLGGELRLSRGSLNVQPGQLASESQPDKPVTVRQLVEEQWDFSQPLLVMGQQMESSASRDLRDAVPNLPFFSLSDLRLRFGPDLRVTVPNVLNFNTAGQLTLNGPLDPSIRASGVVRLLNGRLGLFTTNFSLDPDAPNVAVFTPSLGLIPYLDIALRTRVSDSPTVGGTADRSNIYDWNAAAAPVNSIDQLRLVRVRLEASGPADRLAENIRLTSSPPLPPERLVALIGGNSLVGLVGGNAGAALATVLGQSLLSPLASGLSDAFGQRLSFALYPTYFAPAEALARENPSRRLPSQLVLGSEIGLDISERFNFSVLAAPNRSDIPPQLTLR